MARKVIKRKILTTTVKTVEIDGKKYIEYNQGNTMEDYQNAIINCALYDSNFHPTSAATSLNIGKSTMYRLLNNNSEIDNNKESE